MSRDENEPESSKRSHKRVVKTGTTIFVPHNILKSPLLVLTAVRNNINSTALLATIYSVIATCSGDTKLTYIILSLTDIELNQAILEDIKEKWVPPVVGNLHWDGKLMHSMKTKHEDVERLPVLVSGSYFYNIYNDYRTVFQETVQEMKEKPLKASAYLTLIGAFGILMKTNPCEDDFNCNLMESANQLALVGEPIRSVRTVRHINTLMRNWKDRRLNYVNLGVCSIVYENNYGHNLGLYLAKCGKLKSRWLEFHKSIVDVGVAGHWFSMDNVMKDYDINEDEWDENGTMKNL